MNSILLIVLTFLILTIPFGVGIYFLLYLPKRNKKKANENATNKLYEYSLEQILYKDSNYTGFGKSYQEVYEALKLGGVDEGEVDSLIEQLKDRRDCVKVSQLPAIIVTSLSIGVTIMFANDSSMLLGEELLLSVILSVLTMILIGSFSFMVFKLLSQSAEMQVLNALYAYKRYLIRKDLDKQSHNIIKQEDQQP